MQGLPGPTTPGSSTPLMQGTPEWEALYGPWEALPWFMRNWLPREQQEYLYDVLKGRGWEPQYEQARSLLGKAKGSAQEALDVKFANRGTYGQGPMQEGYRGLEADYAGQLSGVLAQLTGQAQENKQWLTQMMMGAKSDDDYRKIMEEYMNRSWMSSLFEGFGTLAGKGLEFAFGG